MASIAPSILAADFARLGEHVAQAAAGGADRIHVDVMDGHFVPNLSMGAIVVKGLRPTTKLPLEVHLMVTDPTKFLDGFISAGGDSFIVHCEVLPDPVPLLRSLKARGHRVGLAFNPDRPVSIIEPFLSEIDLALCMTVFPGFGGQKFIPASLDRLRELRAMIDRINPTCEIEVDGGIDAVTAPQAAQAGATVFVAGTSVFGVPEGPAEAVRNLLRLTGGAA
jgi:ribulose-phosphate 3-epimerase